MPYLYTNFVCLRPDSGKHELIPFHCDVWQNITFKNSHAFDSDKLIFCFLWHSYNKSANCLKKLFSVFHAQNSFKNWVSSMEQRMLWKKGSISPIHNSFQGDSLLPLKKKHLYLFGGINPLNYISAVEVAQCGNSTIMLVGSYK